MVFCVNEARQIECIQVLFIQLGFFLQEPFSLQFPCTNVPCSGYLGDGRRSKEVQDFTAELNTEENRYQGQAKGKEIDSKGSSTIEKAQFSAKHFPYHCSAKSVVIEGNNRGKMLGKLNTANFTGDLLYMYFDCFYPTVQLLCTKLHCCRPW